MPAVPAFAAVFAVAAAGAATAGAIAGTVAIATAGFAVLGAVGATIGAVGAITKNKTLQMIGLGLGVVGGVGGIASSAGVFGSEAGSIFTPASSGGASLTGDTGATFADSMTPATTGGAGTGGEGFVDSGSWDVAPTTATGAPDLAAQAAWAPNAQLSMATNPATATNQISAQVDTSNATVGDSKGVVSGAAPDPNAPSAQVPGQPKADPVQAGQDGGPLSKNVDTTSPMGPSDPNAVKPGAVTGAPGQTTANATATSGTPADPPGWLGRQFAGITSWAKDNQTLASGLVNGGFGLLKGLGGTTDAQNNYYNANAQANLDLAKLRDQQYANIAAPKAVAYSPPVGSVPALGTQLPGAAGLINRAPTSAVTGATA